MVVVVHIHPELLRVASRCLAHYFCAAVVQATPVQLAGQHRLVALLKHENALVELPGYVLSLVILVLAGLTHIAHAVHGWVEPLHVIERPDVHNHVLVDAIHIQVVADICVLQVFTCLHVDRSHSRVSIAH